MINTQKARIIAHMAIFSKESLETLRSKVDLVEVVSPYLNVKKMGASYKALCPFHVESTPSFVIQKGDGHYHCFGCGAHGDAIAFLMNYLKLTFADAVEFLAEKFGVTLEHTEKEKKDGVDTAPLKKINNLVADFYHYHLLHTDEGHRGVEYLYKRGIDLEFIEMFKVGFAPKDEGFSRAFFRAQKFSEEELILAGVMAAYENGKKRPFFSNRITFPIMDSQGNVIGFSARKIDEEVFGGKYINTQKTPLFNKSKVLFGLNYSRARIAKERKVIVVEGQIDALRLIQEGLNYTVAGQGTAFGEGHVEVLRRLGVQHAFLAFDGDLAGQEAALKVGQYFQKEGVEVSILQFPEKMDPDSVLQKSGLEGFMHYLENGEDFITFALKSYGKKCNGETPAGKNELVKNMRELIQNWKHPIMIHEGLKKIATYLKVPEEMVRGEGEVFHPITAEKEKGIDSNKILEIDLIRWILLMGEEKETYWSWIQEHIQKNDLCDPICKRLYGEISALLEQGESIDMLLIGQYLEREEEDILNILVQKKVNTTKFQEGLLATMQKILERNWMLKREMIKRKIQSGSSSEEEILLLAKEFDILKKQKPTIKVLSQKEEN